MSIPTMLRMAKLNRHHPVEAFECGVPALNHFLARHALASQNAGASQTYLAESGDAIAGYYSLAVGQIAHEDAAERMIKGLARHPVPVMILARLAVDKAWRGKGLGQAMLKDAMRRTAQAADIAGIRALIVHAKDDQAKAFYQHFDFQSLPQEERVLFVLLKDIRRAIGGI
jgi:GNAT superfamily N-acetyltransferase